MWHVRTLTDDYKVKRNQTFATKREALAIVLTAKTIQRVGRVYLIRM